MSAPDSTEPLHGIAIIGMACRFPGADTPRAYWRNLIEGVESITRLSDADLLASGVDKALLGDKRYVKAAPILGDIAGFDARFFGCSPREAALMDPQLRLFLEVAWEAFEDAGTRPDILDGLVGVFAGSGGVVSSYLVDRLQAAPEILGATGELAHIVNDKDFLPTQVSYRLNLRGPSVNVQTACSTSAVAVHLACQSLQSGECDLALAGASVVRVPHHVGYLHQESGILSPDGHCRAFDARAQGTVFGSGIGAVVLKPLDQAMVDRDPVYAVIKGSAINNDGGLKVSYTASSQEGQARAIAEALAFAEVDARSIGYVEAHGTGTLMGDPLEIKALTQAFRQASAPQSSSTVGKGDTGFCKVASVKSNLGHLEQAAGIAGLIKVVLALEKKKIPASLHYEEPNPQIDFDRSPFSVPREVTDWPAGEIPRRAGINSLGLGGTNAFLVLEEAPPSEASPATAPAIPPVLTLSARSETALERLCESMSEHLLEDSEASAADVCFTTQVGRVPFAYRRAVVGSSTAELAERLSGETTPRHPAGDEPPKIAFLFTGQGAQYAGMARGLYDIEPGFRRHLDRCDAILRSSLGESLLPLLWDEEDNSRLHETGWTQPALFAVEVSLAHWLIDRGVNPSALIGHSVGEIAAACVAGVMSLEDGLAWIAERARLMQSLPTGGGMLAIRAGEAEAKRSMASSPTPVALAALNSPENTVIAGPKEALGAIAEQLGAQGLRSKDLTVSHAFHSPLMEPILDDLEQAAGQAHYRAPRIPLVSNLTGKFAEDTTYTPAYWREHARQPVRFAEGMRTLVDAGVRTFVEIGPGRTLLGLGSQNLIGQEASWFPTLMRGKDEPTSLATTLAGLWETGVEIDWAALDPQPRRRVSLPTYPFDRQRYWIEDATPISLGSRTTGDAHPLLGSRLSSPLADTQFEGWLSLATQPYLDDHRMYGLPVLPTTATIEMAAAAAATVLAEGPIRLENLLYQQALVLPEIDTTTAEHRPNAGLIVQTLVAPEANGRCSFRLLSQDPDDPTSWRLHLTGTIVRSTDSAPETPEDTSAERRLADDPKATTDVDSYYRTLRRTGLEYGVRFRGIRALWRKDGEALARVELPMSTISPPSTGEHGSYRAHPALLDACLHLYPALLDETFSEIRDDDPPPVFLPISLESCELRDALPPQVWSHAVRRTESDEESLITDITVSDEDGRLLARLNGLMLRRLPREALLPSPKEEYRDWLYQVQWRNRPRPKPAEAQPGHWLILTDQGGLGTTLSERLEAHGQQSVRVHCEDATHLGRRVTETLALESDLCRGIVVLWPLDLESAEALTAKTLAAGQERVVGGLLALVQAVAAADPAQTRNLRLWIVTRAVHPFGDEPPAGIAQATLWGFGRTVAQELPSVWGGLIDLGSGGSLDDEADHLAAELLAEPADDQILLHGGERRVARLCRLTPPQAAPAAVRDDARYLITGGLGALGLAVARYLAEQGARHLVLTGRSKPSGETATVLNALRDQDLTVTFTSVDVTVADQVQTLITDLRHDGPPLAGIVHCAGLLEDGILTQLDWAQMHRVMAPKVEGAWNLHRATRGLELDFFVLFSSVLGITGSAGQANYTAANTFLDGLAAYRRARGLPALAIGWGPWAEGGLAVSAGERGEEVWRARGTTYIPPQPGIAVLDELMRHALDQATVTITDWNVFVPQLPTRSQAFYEELTSVPNDAQKARPDLLARLAAAAPEGRREMLSMRLRTVVAGLLGLDLDTLDPSVQFAEYGFDSLMAVQLRNQLAQLELSVGLAGVGHETTLEELASAVRTSDGDDPLTLTPGEVSVESTSDDSTTSKGSRIVVYGPEHHDAIARFSTNVWQRPTDDAFLTWRYAACETFHHAYLAMQDRECLATVSAFEKTYRINGEPIQVLEGFDWYSLPELQTSGIGIEVMEALQRQPHPVVGIGGTEEAVALRQRLGWRRIGEATSYMLPLAGAGELVSDRLKVPRSLADLGMAAAGNLWFQPRRRQRPSGGEARQVPEIGTDIAQLYEGETGYRAIQVANPAYIAWLVDCYPAMGNYLPFRFEIDGELRGWALGRLVDTDEGRIASLLDCFAPRPTPELYTWMISEVLLTLAESNPALVRAATTCPILSEALKNNRFRPWKAMAIDCWSKEPVFPSEDLLLGLDTADEAFLPYPSRDA